MLETDSPRNQMGLRKEATMEAISLFLGVALRIVLPIGLLFWVSARLRAWDQKRGATC